MCCWLSNKCLRWVPRQTQNQAHPLSKTPTLFRLQRLSHAPTVINGDSCLTVPPSRHFGTSFVPFLNPSNYENPTGKNPDIIVCCQNCPVSANLKTTCSWVQISKNLIFFFFFEKAHSLVKFTFSYRFLSPPYWNFDMNNGFCLASSVFKDIVFFFFFLLKWVFRLE